MIPAHRDQRRGRLLDGAGPAVACPARSAPNPTREGVQLPALVESGTYTVGPEPYSYCHPGGTTGRLQSGRTDVGDADQDRPAGDTGGRLVRYARDLEPQEAHPVQTQETASPTEDGTQT